MIDLGRFQLWWTRWSDVPLSWGFRRQIDGPGIGMHLGRHSLYLLWGVWS